MEHTPLISMMKYYNTAKLIGIKSSSLQPEAMNRYLLLYKFQSYTNSSYLINLSINFTV